MSLMTSGFPDSPGAKCMCILPRQDRSLSKMDGQCCQNVPWISIRDKACGVSRDSSSNSVTAGVTRGRGLVPPRIEIKKRAIINRGDKTDSERKFIKDEVRKLSALRQHALDE